MALHAHSTCQDQIAMFYSVSGCSGRSLQLDGMQVHQTVSRTLLLFVTGGTCQAWSQTCDVGCHTEPKIDSCSDLHRDKHSNTLVECFVAAEEGRRYTTYNIAGAPRQLECLTYHFDADW